MIASASLLLALAAGGCAVGPDYAAPEASGMPDGWTSLEGGGHAERGQRSGVASSPARLARWWTSFNDSTLNSLIDRAIASNLDLKIATARVREARALRGAADAGNSPTIDARGSYTRTRASSNNGSPFSLGEQNLFSTGLDASWEIDVFGGVGREVEAADADVAAAEEGRHDALVTLLAEVATNYAEARGLQRRLDVANLSVRVQEDSVEVAESRLKAGISGELEVAQARALLETRRALIPVITTSFRQALHRLGVLLGQGPGSLEAELANASPIPPPPGAIPVGLPSDLLRRRPDVRRAERVLAATNARIGVAEADLYPRFSLTGSCGFDATKAGDLFDWDSRSWYIGPAVRWRVFDGNRIRRQIAAAGARSEAALYEYDKTVLSALEEVENRLVAFSQEQARRESLEKATAANQRAVDLSSDLYKAGIRDFLNVLVSQRALYDSQDALVQSDLAVTTNLVALYKALGGGWEEEVGVEVEQTSN
jgi:NodT family efflux transporter outer membrane factor (OMF) lipoprotein